MLTTKQARENQEKYGFNELVEGKKKSTMQIFLEQKLPLPLLTMYPTYRIPHESFRLLLESLS